jgi:hypothetical protein
MPFPTGTTIVVFIFQLVLALVASRIWENEYLNVWTNGGTFQIENFHKTMRIYSAISVLSVLSFHGVGKRAKSSISRKSSISPLPHELEMQQAKFAPFIKAGAVIYIICFILTVDSLNFTYLQSHSEYFANAENPGSILNPDSILATTFSSTLTRISPLTGVMGTLVLIGGVASNIRWVYCALGPLAVCHFVFLLSISSRWAALLPAIIAVAILFSNKSILYKIVTISLFVLLAVYGQIHGLIGRGSSIQGIAGIPSVFNSIFSGDTQISVKTIILNFSEGIFSVAEGWNIQPAYNNEVYSWLSLSPLPSFIDGFNDIRTSYEVRLNDFCPLSGITELLAFGLPKTIICLTLLYVLVRLHIKLSDCNGMLFLAVNFLIFFAIYNAGAYSLRTALRTIWLGYYFWLGYYLTGFSLVAANETSRANDPFPEFVRPETTKEAGEGPPLR